MENKVTAICQECNKQFDYDLKPGFPRKYCFACSKIRKAAYENKDSGEGMPANPQKTAQNQSMGQIATTQGISRVEHEFQSSYEFGPAGNRHTIKYRNMDELKAKIKELQDAGLMEVV